MKLTKITDPQELARVHAKKGDQGPKGDTGPIGPKGIQGIPGVKGDKGEDGVGISRAWVDKDACLMLEYTNGIQVNVGCIREESLEELEIKGNGVFGGGGGSTIKGLFFNEDGELILQQIGKPDINAGSVASSGVKYTEVTTTSYTILEADLIVGINIYGVDSGGDTTVFLPVIEDPTKIVIVSNEMTDTAFTVTTQPL